MEKKMEEKKEASRQEICLPMYGRKLELRNQSEALKKRKRDHLY